MCLSEWITNDILDTNKASTYEHYFYIYYIISVIGKKKKM